MEIVEGYRPGCIAAVTALHAAYYARTAGFGVEFEAKVACELGQFCRSYVAGRDGLWLAQDAGEVHGSIAIDGSGGDSRGAHLRWFITSDAARGRGVGTALLRAALAFVDTCGYGRVLLWTFEGLDAARHLYLKHGFRLVRQAPGAQWGRTVDEQCYVRDTGDGADQVPQKVR